MIVGIREPKPANPQLYVYRWDRCGRKGQVCRVFARSKRMNSVGLRFIEDGFTMVTSGNSLRKFAGTLADANSIKPPPQKEQQHEP